MLPPLDSYQEELMVVQFRAKVYYKEGHYHHTEFEIANESSAKAIAIWEYEYLDAIS